MQQYYQQSTTVTSCVLLLSTPSDHALLRITDCIKGKLVSLLLLIR